MAAPGAAQHQRLDRSFDADDLRKMLLNSQMVVDRSHATSATGFRKRHHWLISRPPMPKGSDIFEKVLDEFQAERLGSPRPEIRVTRPSVGDKEHLVVSGPNGDYCPRLPKGHRGRRSSIVPPARSRSNSIVQTNPHLSPPHGRSRSNSIVQTGSQLSPKHGRSRSNSIVQPARSRSNSIVHTSPERDQLHLNAHTGKRSRSNSFAQPSNSVVQKGRSRSNSITPTSPDRLSPQHSRSRSNSILKRESCGDGSLLQHGASRSRSNSLVQRD